jgi:hypothetical protein
LILMTMFMPGGLISGIELTAEIVGTKLKGKARSDA